MNSEFGMAENGGLRNGLYLGLAVELLSVAPPTAATAIRARWRRVECPIVGRKVAA
jgi:hypothetical protein